MGGHFCRRLLPKQGRCCSEVLPGRAESHSMGTSVALVLVQVSGQPSGAVAKAVPGLQDLPLTHFKERLPKAYQSTGWPVLAGRVHKLEREARQPGTRESIALEPVIRQ